jgi:hypothetical protein
MRTLTDHKINGLNEAITITVMDEPGQGGACHEYKMSLSSEPLPINRQIQSVYFQNGPIQENGVNGISQEALTAILIDRLRSFQDGQYACRENSVALTHFETALMWLHKRTRDRMARGVEGTNVK